MQRNKKQRPNQHRTNSRRVIVAVASNRNLQTHPPRFESTFSQEKTIRYLATSALNGLVISRELLLNMLQIAATSTVTYRLLDAVRCSKLTIWGPSGTATGGASYVSNKVSIQWLSQLGRPRTVSDSSMSIEPAFVSTGPPAMSLAGFWSLSGEDETDEILIITAPVSSIIDFQLQIVYEKEFPFSPTSSASGLTPGQTYIPTIASELAPVDYPTF